MAQELLMVNPPRRRRRSRRNPRGVAWSGVFARPKRKSGKGRRRLVRVRAGRRRSAFFPTRYLGRRVTRQFAALARRAKHRGCKSSLGRSMLKSCRRKGRGGKMRCFSARGKRVCFRTKR